VSIEELKRMIIAGKVENAGTLIAYLICGMLWWSLWRWRTEKPPAAVFQSNWDMMILTTNFRPVKGSKGYYRVQMKHGISQVHTGSRYTFGIIFHDVLS